MSIHSFRNFFSNLGVANLFRFDKDGKLYAVASPYILSLVTLRPDLARNPHMCFVDAEIYFRANDDLYRIHQVKIKDAQDHLSWVLEHKDKQHSAYYLSQGFMNYALLEIGERFRYGPWTTDPVTGIVILTKHEWSTEEAKKILPSPLIQEFFS